MKPSIAEKGSNVMSQSLNYMISFPIGCAADGKCAKPPQHVHRCEQAHEPDPQQKIW